MRIEWKLKSMKINNRFYPVLKAGFLRVKWCFMMLLFGLLCILSGFMYEKSDDWTRTLGYNYDFFGTNRKIYTLYLGCYARNLELNAEYTYGDGEEETGKVCCDLCSDGQSLKDSCFLLRQADRRYRLKYVYLVVETDRLMSETCETGAESAPAGRESDAIYLIRMMEYCCRNGIILTILESGSKAGNNRPAEKAVTGGMQEFNGGEFRKLAEKYGVNFVRMEGE